MRTDEQKEPLMEERIAKLEIQMHNLFSDFLLHVENVNIVLSHLAQKIKSDDTMFH